MNLPSKRLSIINCVVLTSRDRRSLASCACLVNSCTFLLQNIGFDSRLPHSRESLKLLWVQSPENSTRARRVVVETRTMDLRRERHITSTTLPFCSKYIMCRQKFNDDFVLARHICRGDFTWIIYVHYQGSIDMLRCTVLTNFANQR